MITEHQISQLERLIDKNSLKELLGVISFICHQKAAKIIADKDDKIMRNTRTEYFQMMAQTIGDINPKAEYMGR